MSYDRKPPYRFHWWFWALLALVIVLAVWMGNTAYAQDGEPIPIIDEDDDWLTMLIKVALLLTNVVLIPALVQWARARGWQIDEKHTNHLQLTANNAANLLLDSNLTWEQKRAKAIEYMKQGARHAINYHRPSDEKLWELVQAALNSKQLPIIPSETLEVEHTDPALDEARVRQIVAAVIDRWNREGDPGTSG